MVDAVNREEDGTGIKVDVHVKTTSPGSFVIDFSLFQTAEGVIGALPLVGTDGALVDADALKRLIFGGDSSLVGLYKWLHGRKPSKVESLDNESVEITHSYEDKALTVKTSVGRLVKNPEVKEALEDIIYKLLWGHGTSKVSFKVGEETVNEVDEREAGYFDTFTLSAELVADETTTCELSIVPLSFVPDNKWRVSDGVVKFYSSIKDQGLLANVASNKESFRYGDKDTRLS